MTSDFMRAVIRIEPAGKEWWWHVTLECGHSCEALLGPDASDVTSMSCFKCSQEAGEALI